MEYMQGVSEEIDVSVLKNVQIQEQDAFRLYDRIFTIDSKDINLPRPT